MNFVQLDGLKEECCYMWERQMVSNITFQASLFRQSFIFDPPVILGINSPPSVTVNTVNAVACSEGTRDNIVQVSPRGVDLGTGIGTLFKVFSVSQTSRSVRKVNVRLVWLVYLSFIGEQDLWLRTNARLQDCGGGKERKRH